MLDSEAGGEEEEEATLTEGEEGEGSDTPALITLIEERDLLVINSKFTPIRDTSKTAISKTKDPKPQNPNPHPKPPKPQNTIFEMDSFKVSVYQFTHAMLLRD